MDRYSEKEDGICVPIITMLILISGIFIIFFSGDMIFAEVKKEKEKTIELEKEEIYGILERPNVVFPMRWNAPEAPAQNVYILDRSFRKEIFDFVDEEMIRRYYGNTHDDR